MEGKGLLSIIVPVYNVEKYLNRCIDSIRNQTYSNWELLLIDDGSTDGSSTICDEYADIDGRIKVTHIANGGVSNARNIGLELATGEYIAFVDADDFCEKNMYADMMDNMLNYAVDMVYCGYSVYEESDRSKREKKPASMGVKTSEETLNEYFGKIKGHRYSWAPWNKIFSRKLIGDMRFDTSIACGEDLVFSINTLLVAKNVFLNNNCYYNYCIRGRSASRTYGITKNKYDDIKAWEMLMLKFSDNKIIYDSISTITYSRKVYLLAEAYIIGDKENYKIIRGMLKAKSGCKYCNRGIRSVAILKRIMLSVMMALRLPKRLVKIVFDIH